MSKVTLELESWEALMILDPIQLAALDDQAVAAKSTGEKREHASVRAQVRQRIATSLLDQVIPETAFEQMRREHQRDEIELGMA